MIFFDFQATTEDDDADEHIYEAETEEVYYYEEVPDEGMDDTEAVGAEGSYVISEIYEDNAEER